jgi:ABC-type multidrug transport system fused ATPase/permease subunit
MKKRLERKRAAKARAAEENEEEISSCSSSSNDLCQGMDSLKISMEEGEVNAIQSKLGSDKLQGGKRKVLSFAFVFLTSFLVLLLLPLPLFLLPSSSSFFFFEGGARDVMIRGVTITLGEKELLHHADLRLAFGHRYGLVGPNGVGKTTLLKAMTSGKIPG